jgi:linoleate 10R-lipoxygenase
MELYDVLGDIYSYLFLKVDLANNLVLLQKVKKNVNELLGHIKSNLDVGSAKVSAAYRYNPLLERV